MIEIITFIVALIIICALSAFVIAFGVVKPEPDEEQEPASTVTPTVLEYLKTIKFDIYL